MTNCQSMIQTPPPLPCRRWAINSPLTMTRSRIHQWSLSRAKKNNNWRFRVMALKQEVKDPPQSPSHRIRADYRSMTSVDFLFEHMIGVTVYTWIPGGLCRWFMKQCTNVVFFSEPYPYKYINSPPKKHMEPTILELSNTYESWPARNHIRDSAHPNFSTPKKQ